MLMNIDDLIGTPQALPEGAYFSKTKPELIDRTDWVHLNSTDYIVMPYNTDTFIIWRNEKPIEIDYEGQGNYGAALVAQSPGVGYVTLALEDD